MEKYQKLLEKGTDFIALAVKTYRDREANEDGVVLQLDDAFVGYLPKAEFDLVERRGPLNHAVGRKLVVRIKEITEDGKIVVSRKLPLEKRRAELIEEMEQGAIKEAVIRKFLKYGAYVQVRGVSFLLRNQDFSTDHTAVADVHKVGDKINVKLAQVSDKGNLSAEAAEKYTSDIVVNLDEYEKDQVVIGIVRDVKSFGLFVNIAPNLDALCQMPESEDLDIGSKVRFKISKVNHENGKVRGRILDVLDEGLTDEDDELE